MSEERYGKAFGMQEATLAGGEAMKLAGAQRDQDEQDDGIRLEGQGNLLWSYQNEDRLYGIPVEEQFRKLKIDRDETLVNAFELVRRPRLLLVLMNETSEEATRKYNDLLDAVYDGRAEIVDETRQFDPAKSAFLVWVRYNELSFRLHPRYNYLLEE